MSRVFGGFALILASISPAAAQEKNFRLQDVTDALQCAAGQAAKRIGQANIPAQFSKIKFTLTLKEESTNVKEVKAGLVEGIITLFPTASAGWKRENVQTKVLAENLTFRKNLHVKNDQACNRRSNFDTGVVDDIATQISLVAQDPSVIPETTIKASSKVTVTNNADISVSLGIPIVKISGTYGRTHLRSLAVLAVSP